VYVVGIVGAFVIVGGGLALKHYRDTVVERPRPPEQPSEQPAPVEPPLSAEPSTATSLAAPDVSPAAKSGAAPVHVKLKLAPPNAIVKRDGKALTSPEIDIKPGETVKLLVEMPGYYPHEFTVDGSKPEVALGLQPVGAAPPTPTHKGPIDTW
jgi:hypothetical protein